MPKEGRLLQTLKQERVLSQQARIGLYVLQLPLLDLRAYLKQEMLENPMLEEDKTPPREETKDLDTYEKAEDTYFELPLNRGYDREEERRRSYGETLITKPESLKDHLLWQLGIFLKGEQYEIGQEIIGNLDENGYLRISSDELARTFGARRDGVENVIATIQHFDPVGVAARDLRECLLIQLRSQGKEGSLSYKIAENYLDDFEKRRYQNIAKKLKTTLQEVEKAGGYIMMLEPKPGRSYATQKAREVIPDIILKKEQDVYKIEINNEYLPTLTVSKMYSDLLKNKKTDEETKSYLKTKRDRARWLIGAICERQDNIKRISEFIVRFQKDYLESEEGAIRPLTLTRVAKELSLSESTVSRVVANKYIQTGFGTLPLKRFFSASTGKSEGEAVSADFIQKRIQALLEAESRKKPLSDKKIVDLLRSEGITVARRTVTKYREKMKIPPAHARKR